MKCHGLWRNRRRRSSDRKLEAAIQTIQETLCLFAIRHDISTLNDLCWMFNKLITFSEIPLPTRLINIGSYVYLVAGKPSDWIFLNQKFYPSSNLFVTQETTVVYCCGTIYALIHLSVWGDFFSVLMNSRAQPVELLPSRSSYTGISLTIQASLTPVFLLASLLRLPPWLWIPWYNLPPSPSAPSFYLSRIRFDLHAEKQSEEKVLRSILPDLVLLYFPSRQGRIR